MMRTSLICLLSTVVAGSLITSRSKPLSVGASNLAQQKNVTAGKSNAAAEQKKVASFGLTEEEKKAVYAGCQEACGCPSCASQTCVADCEVDMYKCFEITGRVEGGNADAQKACKEEVHAKYSKLSKGKGKGKGK